MKLKNAGTAKNICCHRKIGSISKDLLNQRGQHIPRPDLKKDTGSGLIHCLYLPCKMDGSDQVLGQQRSEILWILRIGSSRTVREDIQSGHAEINSRENTSQPISCWSDQR